MNRLCKRLLPTNNAARGSILSLPCYFPPEFQSECGAVLPNRIGRKLKKLPFKVSQNIRITLAALLLAGLVAGGIWRWHEREARRLSFATATVKRGDIVSTISATGTIEPVEVIDVGAQVAGRISSFGTARDSKTVDYGSVVEESAILAKIDDSVYAADLAVAEAQMEQDKAGEKSASASLEETKAKFVQTEAEWKRAQELSRSKLLAIADFDSYKANFEIAKANVLVAEASVAQARAAVVKAQANLDRAKRNLDFCTIKSPVDGVIIDRRVNIGQTVVASFNAPSLFLIAKDLTKMQIWVAVNEADVGRIVPDSAVTFTCDAFPDQRFMGAVGKVRLNATMTQNVVMYTVEVNTDNSKKILIPYLTANVRFLVQKESGALLVPNAALRWSPLSLEEVAPEFRTSPLLSQSQGNPSDGGVNASKPEKSAIEHQGVVWLKETEFVKPIEVKVGISDGANSAVSASGLNEGAEVVTGEVSANMQSKARNPFLPQVRRR
jgi:HlyD family secretion protein